MTARDPAMVVAQTEGPWRVVAGAFLVNLAAFGGAYTFSAFVAPLQAEFGTSRAVVSLAFSLAAFLYFSLGLASGPLADRWGARPLVLAGMGVMAAGLGLAGLARTVSEVLAAYALGVGLGVGLAYVPVLGAVQKAFDRRRGLASGLAVAGIGVGTLAIPPVAAWLIAAAGWRSTYGLLAALTLLAGLLAAFLLGPRPPSVAARSGDLSMRDAVRTPRFWRLYGACVAAAFGAFVPFAHLVPYAADRGVGAAQGALLVAAIGVGSTAGRFLIGDLADRMGRTNALLASFAGMGFCLAAWPLAGGFAALAVFAVVFGVVYGGWVALLPAHVADRFGQQNAGGIIGALYTAVALGALAGPSLAGWAYDVTGDYAPVLLGAAAANGLAMLLAADRWPGTGAHQRS